MKRLLLFGFLVYSVSGYTQRNDWSVNAPWPQSNHLNAVYALSENTAIAVGEYSTLLKTTDGGASWVFYNDFGGSLMWNLSSVFFIDEQNGWIIGNEDEGTGLILRTTDGGEYWSEQYAPVNQVEAIHFANSQIGWILHQSGEIFKTTNGGISWDSLSTIEIGFANIYFTDTDTGWTIGTWVSKMNTEDIAVIRKTTDGGVNWFNQSLPLSAANAVHFLSQSTGIVTGPNGGIARTTDGGVSWYTVASGVTQTLHAVNFADALTGWIAGNNGVILTTLDGGINWTQQVSGGTSSLNGINAYNSSAVWAVGNDGDIIKTSDGGALWTKVSRTLVNGDFYSVSFPNETNGWTLATDWEAYQDKIFRTTDGGQTWYQAVYFDGAEMIDLFSTDEQHCWTVGLSGNLHYTTDGGLTWQDGNAGFTPYLNSVFFINNTIGWTCGGGYVFKTTNGGNTWYDISPGSLMDCFSVFFIDENTGWVASDMGNKEGLQVIKKTTDGGALWFNQSVPPNVPLVNEIRFIDNMNGFIVGEESSILRTTNGGDAWELRFGGITKRTAPFDANLKLIKGRLYDKTTGKISRPVKSGPIEQLPALWAIGHESGERWYALGDQGTIMRTTDGGQTWGFETSGIVENLYDVTFPAAGRGWSVGTYGTILKYHFDYAPEPTAQPTNLTFSDVTIRGFRVQFDQASPSVDGYIAVRRKGAEPDFTPVDGVQYSAKAGFGENEIAYVGSDIFFIENELLPNNEYYYAIYSYNGTDETINYLTVDPLHDSQSTLFSSAIFVTTDEDYADGCLRYAIDSANNHAGADTILFALYGGVVLSYLTDLPAITDDFTCIDGDMNLDNIPDVTLSLSGLDSATLEFISSYNTIKGLILNNNQSIDKAALVINGGHYNKIIGNYIGTDNNGTWQIPNETGIMIYNGSYNQIGDGTASGRNVISGNYTGVAITGEFSRSNEILGNYIGFDATGLSPLTNVAGIVLDAGASFNQIGSHETGGRNLFSNYEEPDLMIPCSVMMGVAGTDSNYVIGNWFGINADGEPIGGLGGVGFYFGANNNFLGDGTVEGRNIIAGHYAGAMSMSADSNTILGNYFGTLPDGITPVMNYNGLLINGSGHIIGDTTEGGRNIIGTNEEFAIALFGGDPFGGGGGPVSQLTKFDKSTFKKFKDKSHYTTLKNPRVFKKTNRVYDRFKTAYLKRKNIEALGEASNNRITGNYIGVAADGITPLYNGNGIVMDTDIDNHDNVTGNLFERNIIANSANNGIGIASDVNIKNNRFFANSIYNNAGDGIYIEFPSQDTVWAPNIFDYNSASHLLTGNASAGAMVQIYADNEDQGKVFIDTTYADENGNWSINVMPSLNMNFTALQDSNGNTSMFSEPFSSGLIDPLMVTRTTDDNNLGSLRYAIEYANANTGPDVIRFMLPKGSVIYLSDMLTALYDTGTTIEGDMDTDGYPDIVINSGSGIEGSIIDIYSSYNIIKGLVLQGQNFSDRAAITIDGGHHNQVLSCYIGTDITGMSSAQNYCGVKITNGATFNQIGDGTVSGRNVISGNREGTGVMISESGTNYNKVSGNYFGLNAAGTDSLPNQTSLFIHSGARSNIIGGYTTDDRNLICAYDPQGGIIEELTGGTINIMGDETDSNRVVGNWFGLNAFGNPLNTSGKVGVTVSESSANNFIGDGMPGGGNVIANSAYGVLFHYADSNYVYGNLIGTDPTGDNAIPNETGVVIRKSSSNQVGGADPLLRNVISGNSIRGVEVVTNNISGGANSLYNSITGNYIGVKADGVSPMGNAFEGIYFESKSGWNVTNNEADDNVIAYNGTYGVSFNGSSTYENYLFRNSIFNNTSGGIYIDSVAQNNILPPAIDSIVGRTVYGSMANSGAQIQLYWDEGNQGQHFIDTTQESSDGLWSYILPDSIVNYNITALQTDNHNASAFSAPVMVVFPLIVNRMYPYSGPGTLDYAVNYANTNPGPDSIKFKLPQQTIIYSDMTYILSSDGTVIDGDMNHDGIPDIGIARSNIYLQSAVSITGNNNTLTNMLIGGYQSQYHEATLYITGQYNKILGNYLGMDFNGNLGTGWDQGHNVAVKLALGAKYNIIGDGSVPGRNIIANSAVADIHISGIGTDSNSILGNYIGLNKTGSDTIDGGMGQMNVVGILISDGAKTNFIGDGSVAGRNIISGHRSNSAMTDNGVRITGFGTDFNEINGNYIGTGPTGNESRANVTGVYIQNAAQHNVVKNNLISGNLASGIIIESDSTRHNQILGNLIGMNAAGTAALPNEKGVMIIGANNNSIGDGTIPGRNIISGNAYHGIHAMSDSGNVIVANYIGTDITGNTPIGNLQNGIFLYDGSRYNHIDRNVIAGNGKGINILQAGTVGVNRNHVITGNLIGTNAAGTAAIGNVYGIILHAESGAEVLNVFIGDGTPPSRNVISGNDSMGILIEENAHDNFVYSNYIGVDLNGTGNLGNGADGIRIQNEANYNYIGNGTVGGRNVISGNLLAGIIIENMANNNYIHGNFIGTDHTGTVLIGNALDGIRIYDSYGTQIGNGMAGGINVIAGNNTDNPTGDFAGIILDFAFGTIIDSNHIGTDLSGTLDLGNHGYGIRSINTSQNNTIFSNLIAHNDSGGVILEGSSTTNHTISYNQFIQNGPFNLLYTDGAQRDVRMPGISSVQAGNLVTGFGLFNSMIQIYKATGANSRTLTFCDTTYADGSGNWSKVVSISPGEQVTALSDSGGITSMFATLYTPLIGTPGITPSALNFGNRDVGDSVQSKIKIGTNGYALQITSVTSGLPSIFRIDSVVPAPVATLMPGDTMNVFVTFKPSSYISYSDSISINYVNASSPLIVHLTGTGSGIGNLSLSKNESQFGNVVVNTAKLDTVYLTANNGPVQIDTIEFTQNNAFTLTNAILYPHILNAGETLPMGIRFLPPDTGIFDDTMSIINNSGVNPLFVTMRGTGTIIQIGNLISSAGQLNFGDVLAGDVAGDEIKLTAQNAPVDIDSIRLKTGTHYSVTPSQSIPFTIGLSDTLILDALFSPAGFGNFTDTIFVYNNSTHSPLAISLTGNGVAGSLMASSDDVNFGTRRIGDSAAVTIVFRAETGMVQISQISQSAGGTVDFTVLNAPTLPVVLHAGTDSLPLQVRFKPVSGGTKLDTMKIFNNSTAQEYWVTLQGFGQVNNIPNAFALKSVGTDNLTNDRTPDFAWEGKGDPDGDALSYIIEVSKVSDFATIAYRDTTPDTTLTASAQLDSIGSYFWRVTAHDGWGGIRTTNTGYFRIDAVPAGLTAGTFFSSVLKKNISVNVIASKLMRTMNASIGLRSAANALVDSTTKAIDLESAANRFYQTPYKLISAGKLFLTITGTDSAQNITTVSKNYNISTIAKDQALAMNSANGSWQVTAPKRTFDENGFLMVNELNHETKILHDQSVMTMAKASDEWTAVNDGLNIQGSALIRSGQGCTVTLTYDQDMISELQSRYADYDERKIGMYAEINGEWMYTGGEGRNGQVQAKVKQYGMVKLMYNPDHEFLPVKVELAQNYPNPFNPTTTIRFGIPQEGKVKLTVYNVLGQKVKELVNDSRSAGYYNVIWNGRSERGNVVSSGVYLYRLEISQGVVARKMVLVK